jgi:hypothetical protein
VIVVKENETYSSGKERDNSLVHFQRVEQMAERDVEGKSDKLETVSKTRMTGRKETHRDNKQYVHRTNAIESIARDATDLKKGQHNSQRGEK